jgi:hypothetical protein
MPPFTAISRTPERSLSVLYVVVWRAVGDRLTTQTAVGLREPRMRLDQTQRSGRLRWNTVVHRNPSDCGSWRFGLSKLTT